MFYLQDLQGVVHFFCQGVGCWSGLVVARKGCPCRRSQRTVQGHGPACPRQPRGRARCAAVGPLVVGNPRRPPPPQTCPLNGICTDLLIPHAFRKIETGGGPEPAAARAMVHLFALRRGGRQGVPGCRADGSVLCDPGETAVGANRPRVCTTCEAPVTMNPIVDLFPNRKRDHSCERN